MTPLWQINKSTSAWRWTLGIAVITLMLLVVIAYDLFPPLRGPAWTTEWTWWYNPNKLNLSWKILIPVVIVLVAWGLVYLFRHRSKLPPYVLLGLVALGVALQLSVDSLLVQPVSSLFYRSTYFNHYGYFIPADRIENLGQYFDEFADGQVTGMQDPEYMRVRTHPPGFVTYYWLMLRIQPHLPAVTEQVSAYLNEKNFHAGEWLEMDATEEAAAYTASLIISVLTVISLIPLYGLGIADGKPNLGKRLALLWIVTSSVVLYIAMVDQMLTLFTAASLFFAFIAVRDEAPLYMLIAGVICSIGTFMTLAFLVILGICGMLILIEYGRRALRRDWQAVRSTVVMCVALGIGLLSVWVLTVLVWGLEPLAILRNSMDEHMNYDELRSYWVWLFYNPYELLFYAGIPFMILFCYEMFHLVRGIIQRAGTTLGDRLMLACLILLVMLIISGASRAEVARQWLFLTPVVVLGAVRGIERLKLNDLHVLIIALLQVTQILFFANYITMFV